MKISFKTILLVFFGCSVHFLSAQIGTQISPQVNPQNNNEPVSNPSKADSLPPNEEILSDIVEYYGEDYVYVNKEENRVYLYNKAYVAYEDYRIDAGFIIIDNNTREVFAKGIDSAGVYTQAPVFVQAQNKIIPDSLRFNFSSKRKEFFCERSA